ncbi:hypothetical protein FOA43_002679 [Brettanomyces nanus]|uniref:Uncharacterized protein n=1 Tax=Eeniella nana TaxID=13502 RepID=A0A875S1T3_EENNA|nr:uncharacterized protein FOA43_002679 [Brettanomyces nanus]QPG75326.1 hypothetical protein FOA43_002679 [Brettanomyces nanus]
MIYARSIGSVGLASTADLNLPMVEPGKMKILNGDNGEVIDANKKLKGSQKSLESIKSYKSSLFVKDETSEKKIPKNLVLSDSDEYVSELDEEFGEGVRTVPAGSNLLKVEKALFEEGDKLKKRNSNNKDKPTNKVESIELVKVKKSPKSRPVISTASLVRRTRSATRKPTIIDLTVDSSNEGSSDEGSSDEVIDLDEDEDETSESESESESEDNLITNPDGVILSDKVTRVLKELNYTNKDSLDVESLLPKIKGDEEGISEKKEGKKLDLQKQNVVKSRPKIVSNRKIDSDIISLLRSRKSRSGRTFNGVPVDYNIPHEPPRPIYSSSCVTCLNVSKQRYCNRQYRCDICVKSRRPCKYPQSSKVINRDEIEIYANAISMRDNGIWDKRFEGADNANENKDEGKKVEETQSVNKRRYRESKKESKRRKVVEETKKTKTGTNKSTREGDADWVDDNSDVFEDATERLTQYSPIEESDSEFSEDTSYDGDSETEKKKKNNNRNKRRNRYEGSESDSEGSTGARGLIDEFELEQEEENLQAMKDIAGSNEKALRILKELDFENRDVRELYMNYGERNRRLATKENYVELEGDMSDLSEGAQAYKNAEDAAEPIILSDDEAERRMLRGHLPLEYVHEMRNEH